MAILSKDEAQQLLRKVLSYSKADECQVSLTGSDGGNIRYARNSVSTAGEISQLTLVVNSIYGKKSGIATIDEFDDASLEKVVRRAEELAQLAPENPELMPLLGPQDFPEPIGDASKKATGLAEDMPSLAELSRRYAAHVLQHVGGNKSEAARLLGVDRKTLYKLLEAPEPEER